MRVDNLCLDVEKLESPVKMAKCHEQKGNQLWEFNGIQLIHPSSKQCMAVNLSMSKSEPRMVKCNVSDENQQWILKN